MDKFEDKEVLVTGGAGFIGSHLVDELLERGAKVTVLDDLSSGKLENLNYEKIEFIEGDVRDESLVNKLVDDSELVFHLAANASVPKSVENPEMDYTTNFKGTFNVVNSCRKSDIEKLVYASTAAVYGEPEYTPMDEDHPLNPISPYGASKLSGEKIGTAFSEAYDIPFVALRIFNVYGPRQRKYVTYDFIKKLKENPDKLEVLGSGEQQRSFCYVEDAVRAFLLAAKKGKGVYNLAGDSLVKIKELAKIIVEKISPKAEICCTGTSWKGDIKSLIPDNTKIKSSLGFRCEVPLENGIERLIGYYENR